jgi:hypothetical protein
MKIQGSLKSDNNNRYFTWRLINIFYHISLSSSWNEKLLRQIKTRILYSIHCLRKSFRLWDNVEKYCRGGQVTDDSIAHVHCMLGIYGYKHTLKMCNTYCFSTVTIFTRTRLSVTLYVNCPPPPLSLCLSLSLETFWPEYDQDSDRYT